MDEKILIEELIPGDFILVSGRQTFLVVGYLENELYIRGLMSKDKKNILSPNVQVVEIKKKELPYWIKKVPPIAIDGKRSKSVEQIQFI